MGDAMAYRGFTKARMVSTDRMNAYVQDTFHLSKSNAETKEELVPFRVPDCSDPWEFIYDI